MAVSRRGSSQDPYLLWVTKPIVAVVSLYCAYFLLLILIKFIGVFILSLFFFNFFYSIYFLFSGQNGILKFLDSLRKYYK
jgi:hypothetical protein